MKEYIINGGQALDGTVEIRGAKNSILPLLAGSILTDEITVLHNCPNISDVDSMIKILEGLGSKIIRNSRDIVIDNSMANKWEIPAHLAKELRSSIFLLGSLLSRNKKAKVAYPGGCDIGLRPIDIHKRIGNRDTRTRRIYLLQLPERKERRRCLRSAKRRRYGKSYDVKRIY